MTESSCKTFRFISSIQNKTKKQLKEKLQSHGVWLFTPSVLDMGQTSQTCQEWHQAFTAVQQTTLMKLCLQTCHFSLASMKPWNKNESWPTRNICVVQLVLQSMRSPCTKCALEEADVHCGPRLQEMYRPGPYGGRWRDSACFHRPTKSPFINTGEEWGVACPLPHKWTTQQNPLKGKSCVTLEVNV